MGGTDTMRGVAFQHAAAVLACIEALGDATVASVTVEGTADVIDFFASADSGDLIWARQLKTRSEPYTWHKADLLAVLKAWAVTEFAGSVPFEFITDGQLTKTGLELAQQLVDGQHLDVAKSIGVGPGMLKNVSIVSRAPSAAVLLEQAELKLLRAGEPLVTVSQARARVAELLSAIVLASGEEETRSRSFPIDELSLILGVLPASLRSGHRHNATGALGALVPRTDLVAQVDHHLGFSRSSRGRVALWGFSGFGKTAVANQVYDLVVAQNLNALLVRLDSVDDVHTVLARVLAQVRGSPPSNQALSALAGEIRSATAALDLLICDDLRSPEAAEVLAASVAPRTALLITARSQHVSGSFDLIEVGPLGDSDVEAVLQAEAPNADVSELARLIHGWPLLLDLVRTSLGRHMAIGGSQEAIVAEHARRLRRAGPPDFDNVSKATRAAIDLALEAVPSPIRQAAKALGVLRTSQPLPLALFMALWDAETGTAQHYAVSLVSVGLLRVGGPGELSIHDALAATLRAMLDPPRRWECDLRLAGSETLGRSPCFEYFTEHLPVHLASGGAPSEALRLLGEHTWCDRVVKGLGAPVHLGRQALEVFTVLRDSERAPILMVLASWLIYRLYATVFVLDRRVAVVFAAVHGLRLTETLLSSAGRSDERASAHSALAAALVAGGQIADANRNAAAALAVAGAEAALELPDTLLVTIQTLGRADQGWVRASFETLVRIVDDQSHPSNSHMTRAVASSTLLAFDPDLARRLAEPLVDRVRKNLSSQMSLEKVFGEDVETTVRNLLPILACTDYDLALSLSEKATEEDIINPSEGERYMIPGLLIAGVAVEDDALPDLDADGAVSTRDLVEGLAFRGRYADAIRVADAVSTRRRRALLHAAIGRVMHQQGCLEAEVEGQFKLAIGLCRGLEKREVVGLLPALANDLLGFDPAWARKLAQQAVRLSNILAASERVSVEGAARALLSQLDPSELDPAIDELLSHANSSRPPRAPVDTHTALAAVEEYCFASIVANSETLPIEEFMGMRSTSPPATVRYSERGPYWDRWFERLLARRSVDDAAAVLRDPQFGSSACQTSQTAAMTAWLLLGTNSEPDWSKVHLMFSSPFSDAFTVDLSLFRLAFNYCTPSAARAQIEQTEANLERIHGLAGVDAFEALKAGSTAPALAALLEAYLTDKTFYGIEDYGTFISGGRRMRLAIRTALDKRITFTDLEEAMRGHESESGASDFLADALALTDGIDLEALQRMLGRMQVPHHSRRQVLLVGLRQMILANPSEVSDWLRRQSTELGFEESLELDDWAELAGAVLAKLGSSEAETALLERDARSRLMSGEAGVEAQPAIELAVKVAPQADDEALAFLKGAVSPWVLGPALCLFAASRPHSLAEWSSLILSGLQMARAGVADSAAAIASLLGQSISAAGEDRMAALAASGALEDWPGQFVGAAYGAAGMMGALSRYHRATDMLEFLRLVRAAGRRAGESINH